MNVSNAITDPLFHVAAFSVSRCLIHTDLSVFVVFAQLFMAASLFPIQHGGPLLHELCILCMRNTYITKCACMSVSVSS